MPAYTKRGNMVIVRLDPGEEIIAELKNVCMKEKVIIGTVQGIGSTNKVTIGSFSTATKEYHKKTFTEDHEIVSLMGNITTMNDEVYLHLHITLGDKGYNTWSGHLDGAVVSGTAEIIITLIDGKIGRYKDEKVGLNLLRIGNAHE